MVRLLFMQVISLVFIFQAYAFSAKAIPAAMRSSWWLQHTEPSSIFHNKKGFKHLKFNNKKELVIAVVDSGVDFSHPFLKNHQYKQNGKHKDFNFFSGTNSDADLIDHQGHGTHVAGTILAAIKKINPKANVKFISIKIFADPVPKRQTYASKKVKRKDPSQFGYYQKEAAIYLTKLKRQGVNILAVNASYGGSDFNKDEFKAVSTLLDNDILLIAAAGNDGKHIKEKGKKFFPAAYSTQLPGVISVGNIKRNGELKEDSNFGAIVSILAPGSEITSTWPGGGYSILSGTSMATPQVTAAVSLIKALKPKWNTLEIKSYLLKNSRFNAGYLQKTGSASRLDMDLLFRPKKKSYDFSQLVKLPKENFTNQYGEIIKNTRCILGVSSILCGGHIDKKNITHKGKQKSIIDIAGTRNIKTYEKTFMNIVGENRIIESSLMSLIHGLSKNDEIFRQMLTKGFQYKDLYKAVGPGLLKKYYESNTIIPVLSKKEFLRYYPFATSDDGGEGRAYAKYIQGLLNSPPQYLDRVGAAYMTRATPKIDVEIALSKAFPLPLNSYLVGHMANRRLPDMIGSIKAMPKRELRKPIYNKDRAKLIAIKNLTQKTLLTKNDLKYLKERKTLNKSFSNSLGSYSSSRLSGSSPLKAIRKEAEQKLSKPVVVSKVGRLKPIDKNQALPPSPPVAIVKRLNKLEKILTHSARRNMEKRVRRITDGISSSPKTNFTAVYKIKKNKTSKKKDSVLVTDISIRNSKNSIEDMEKMAENTRKYYKALLANNKKSDTNDFDVDRYTDNRPRSSRNWNKDSTSPTTKPPSEPFVLPSPTLPEVQPGTKPSEPPEEGEPEINIDFDTGLRSKEHFLCEPNNYEKLFKQLSRDTKEKNVFLNRVFCKDGNTITGPELPKAMKTLSQYNLCNPGAHYKNKTFSELVSPGFGNTKCNREELLKPCSKRIQEDLARICNKILPNSAQYKNKENFREFLGRCRGAALSIPGIKPELTKIGPSLAKFMKNHRRAKSVKCRNGISRSLNLPDFYSDLKLLKAKLPYKANLEAKKKHKNIKEQCESAKIIFNELSAEYVQAIETGKILNRIPHYKEIDTTTPQQVQHWLITTPYIDLADDYIYSCTPKSEADSNFWGHSQ